MTEQEQIEEMAKFMHYKAHGKDKDCDNEKCEMCWCSCKNDAELLYNAGYRKASDMIDEFVERLKNQFDNNENMNSAMFGWKISDIKMLIDLSSRNFITELADEMRQEVEK